MPPSRLLAAVLVVPALALGACTQQQKSSTEDFQGDQRAVAQAIEDLQKAASDRDGSKICEQLLAGDLVRTIERASKTDCAQAVGDRLDDSDAFELTVEKVQISGNRATASVKSDIGSDDRVDQLGLTRDGRNWKLSSLGGR